MEIDRNLCLEMSTGFGGPERKALTTTQMILTIDELDEVIKNLSVMREDLRGCKVCAACQTINHRDAPECQTCEEPLCTL